MRNNSFEQDAHYAIASFVPLKLGVRSKIYENRVKNVKNMCLSIRCSLVGLWFHARDCWSWARWTA
jgi:hypothetical protein